MTNAVTRISAGNAPVGMVEFGNKMWVANQSADTVSVIDIPSRTETLEIPGLGNQPRDLLMDAAGSVLLVSVRDEDIVALP